MKHAYSTLSSEHTVSLSVILGDFAVTEIAYFSLKTNLSRLSILGTATCSNSMCITGQGSAG